MTSEALKDRDPSKPNTEQGLYRKFDVFRTDLSDQPGGKHHGCEYFVLDLTHDPHAKAALAAYAVAVNKTHPQLAADLCQRYDLSAMEGEAVAGCEFPDCGRDGNRNGGAPGCCKGSKAKPFGHYFRDMAGNQHFHTGAEAPCFAQSEITPLYTAPPPQQAADKDEDTSHCESQVDWTREQLATQPQQAGGDAFENEYAAADESKQAMRGVCRYWFERGRLSTTPQPEAGGASWVSVHDRLPPMNVLVPTIKRKKKSATGFSHSYGSWNNNGGFCDSDARLFKRDADYWLDNLPSFPSTTPAPGGEGGGSWLT